MYRCQRHAIKALLSMFFSAVALLVVAGCGERNRVSSLTYQDYARKHPRWIGTYVTAPSEFSQLQGQGYTSLRFLRDGSAEIEAHDQDYPELTWIGRGKLNIENREAMSLVCERITVLHVSTNQPDQPQAILRHLRGKSEERGGPALLQARLEQFRAHSPILRAHYPRPFLDCGAEKILITRKVAPGGILRLELTQAGVSPLLLTDVNDPSFAVRIDRFPHRQAIFSRWKEAESLPPLAKSEVVADSHNSYLPSVLAHRYYLLPRWSISEDGKTLQWTRAHRLDFKKERLRVTKPTYFELELARWDSPRLGFVTIEQGGVPQGMFPVVEADHVNGDQGRLDRFVFFQSHEQGTFKVRLGYRLPYASNEALWQELEVSVEQGRIAAVKPLEVRAVLPP